MATTHTLLFLPSSDLSETSMSEHHQPHSLVRGWGTGAPLAEPLSAFAPDVCSLRCYYEGTNAPIGNVTGGWVLGRGVTSHLHPQSSKLHTPSLSPPWPPRDVHRKQSTRGPTSGPRCQATPGPSLGTQADALHTGRLPSTRPAPPPRPPPSPARLNKIL